MVLLEAYVLGWRVLELAQTRLEDIQRLILKTTPSGLDSDLWHSRIQVDFDQLGQIVVVVVVVV